MGCSLNDDKKKRPNFDDKEEDVLYVDSNFTLYAYRSNKCGCYVMEGKNY